jgi:hypothetical protein
MGLALSHTACEVPLATTMAGLDDFKLKRLEACVYDGTSS